MPSGRASEFRRHRGGCAGDGRCGRAALPRQALAGWLTSSGELLGSALLYEINTFFSGLLFLPAGRFPSVPASVRPLSGPSQSVLQSRSFLGFRVRKPCCASPVDSRLTRLRRRSRGHVRREEGSLPSHPQWAHFRVSMDLHSAARYPGILGRLRLQRRRAVGEP